VPQDRGTAQVEGIDSGMNTGTTVVLPEETISLDAPNNDDSDDEEVQQLQQHQQQQQQQDSNSCNDSNDYEETKNNDGMMQLCGEAVRRWITMTLMMPQQYHDNNHNKGRHCDEHGRSSSSSSSSLRP
jgi:hypothetical protein